MNTVIAYAYGSGQIGFVTPPARIPKGTLLVARGPEDTVRQVVSGLARHAYDGETLLVPGVPEAPDMTVAYQAFTVFFDRVQFALGRR